MSCEMCEQFPVPTKAFKKIGVSIKREGTLYRCKYCGVYFEVIRGNWSFPETTRELAEKFYMLSE